VILERDPSLRPSFGRTSLGMTMVIIDCDFPERR
jgi:hypothetical protein